MKFVICEDPKKEHTDTHRSKMSKVHHGRFRQRHIMLSAWMSCTCASCANQKIRCNSGCINLGSFIACSFNIYIYIICIYFLQCDNMLYNIYIYCLFKTCCLHNYSILSYVSPYLHTMNQNRSGLIWFRPLVHTFFPNMSIFGATLSPAAEPHQAWDRASFVFPKLTVASGNVFSAWK